MACDGSSDGFQSLLKHEREPRVELVAHGRDRGVYVGGQAEHHTARARGEVKNVRPARTTLSAPADAGFEYPRQPPLSVRVVHEDSGEVLASDVETADSLLAKVRGLRFRRSFPDGRALVFPFGSAGRRDVDMLCVPFPIDTLWLVEDEVERVETLRPWIGFGIARADTLVELPAGTADGVDQGHRVAIRD